VLFLAEEYFETSFRFKWGVGSIIEFITEVLSYVVPSAGIDFAYELEGIRYEYLVQEKRFSETGENFKNTYSTKTNFVLEVPSKSLFDEFIVTFGNQYLKKVKERLITEFQEENGRSRALHEVYDELENFDAILTYTELNLEWMDDQTLVVNDPNPQRINDDESFFMG
jgi:hypothetical protein